MGAGRRARLDWRDMRYAEYPAPPQLAAVVDCFWNLEAEGSGAQEPIFPEAA